MQNRHPHDTPYHAKLFAFELSRRHPSGDPDAMITALFDAAVDLNPHQVEAALFAMRSPIQKGCLLADEVGLGKTIEAGLILCQQWAERHRKLLVICPASLRQQWAQELSEKFHLPSLILDARTFAQHETEGYTALASGRSIIITSYHFAHRLSLFIEAIAWDLVVIDEAHKLRNCYRTSNAIGQSLLKVLANRRKLLLTATPFQNSLLELYGLATLIDPMLFGDIDAFKSMYSQGDLTKLRDQLRPVCTRTLRRQVQEYVRYTNRIPMTQSFEPSPYEHRLYESVTAYLQRDDTLGLPGRQRHLTALILCKLLASSTPAVCGTLQVIQERLRQQLLDTSGKIPNGLDPAFLKALTEDDLDTDLLESLMDADPAPDAETPSLVQTVKHRQAIETEIATLQKLIDSAGAITVDAKTQALLTALERGFSQLKKMGANDKALIFTESRRTQDYLVSFLESHGYRGQIVVFNGSGGSAAGAAIYESWRKIHGDTDRATGSRAVDQRTALIDHFQGSARIMIATEAAAEGVNLLFPPFQIFRQNTKIVCWPKPLFVAKAPSPALPTVIAGISKNPVNNSNVGPTPKLLDSNARSTTARHA